MKIIDQASERRGAVRDLQRKLEEVLALLATGQPAHRLLRLRELGVVLAAHTPHAYLLAPPQRQLADWMLHLLEVVESRKQEVAVRLFPFGERDRALLVTNCLDAPYLLDTVQATLARSGLQYQVICHPILEIRRRQEALLHLGESGTDETRESLIVIDLEREEGSDPRLVESISLALRGMLRVGADRRALERRLLELEAVAEREECQEFWRWLRQGNFLPFAYRRVRVTAGAEGMAVTAEEGSSLGLEEGIPLLDVHPGSFDAPPEELSGWLRRTGPVLVEETPCPSPVDPAAFLRCLALRQQGDDRTRFEHFFFGIFTQKSIDEPATAVPSLRHRLETALADLGIPKGCYDWRRAVEVFSTFPKCELFFLDPDSLRETVRSMTLIHREATVKVVAAPGLSVQGLTLLVLMPRSFYGEDVHGRIETYLRRYFASPQTTLRVMHLDSEHLSLHASLQTTAAVVRLDSVRLEHALTRIALPWAERLRRMLARRHGERLGAALQRRYGSAFPEAYRRLVHPRYACRDIGRIEELLRRGREVFDLWGPFGRPETTYRLQYYSLVKSSLNELMPLLESLGLAATDEHDFVLEVDGRTVHLKSFNVREAVAGRLCQRRDLLLEALVALRSGGAENDTLNRLLVTAGLSWRQIDVFRGYRNYWFQLGAPFGHLRFASALLANATAATLLYRYFEARFKPDPRWRDPLRREEAALSPLRQELLEELERVADINEDRVLRTLFNLIDSTVRTSFFRRVKLRDYFFAFKISALGIIEMPAPRPLYEIYVHAAEMEGIHLRGGKVARGGIRWSDRPDDFRTEILGLMKTQMSKNAQIVPVGAKGGFVLKGAWRDRDEGMALAQRAYRVLIHGLLDLTDNRQGERVVRPRGIVAYDEPDPYLVVAADKGTAHLSDTANSISAEYGFWLGDAFASGGSHGYDHKQLGITARGAWVCVERHFREAGRDIRREPFTVVGIGDMSGDVFGNGMLLSRQTRLLAAFDHRHIFLDPDPDPEISWRERKRLFDLDRSSWSDYDRTLISPGGGVWPREAKDIPLSEPVRRWVGVRQSSLDGPGLIRLLLGADVDLLWNGGIGTYVKASSEKSEEAGDRANDSVRIDAAQLRARVVGEGGNLGFTQRGRIEYALSGGRINTDAVDNSAGVDCSDHEVNLKILLQLLLEMGEVASPAERDRLLAAMTDEVCAVVLDDNYGQSLCLSLDEQRARTEMEPFLALAERLEVAGLLDRFGDGFPSNREVRSRAPVRLTRPELAVLMASAKMQLKHALLESPPAAQPGDPALLASYFPAAILERFAGRISAHPLAGEIAATVAANFLINRAGSTCVHQLAERTGAAPADVASAYLLFDRMIGAEPLRRKIFELDGRLPAQRQYDLLLQLEAVLGGVCSQALAHRFPLSSGAASAGLERQRDLYANHAREIAGERRWQLREEVRAGLEAEGIPPGLAASLASLPLWQDFLPAIVLAAETGAGLVASAECLASLRVRLDIAELQKLLANVPIRERWDRMLVRGLESSLEKVLGEAARAFFREGGGTIEDFLSRRKSRLQAYETLRQQLRTPPANCHPFMVLLQSLESLFLP